MPPPSWAASVSANSVEPGRPGELVLFSAPDRASPRRGVAGDGVSLPFFGTRRGSGCTGSWWLVGPLAWTCSDEADLSAEAAAAPERTLDASGLAAPYAFIQTAGASAYASLESAEEGEPDRELEAGWAVAIAEHRERWERTTKGLWIAQQDLHPARPSAFQGVTLALPHAGPLDIAWVLADHASVWPDPTARGKPSGVRAHFQVVRVVGEQGPMLHLDDGTWIAAADVARPHAVPPPALVTHPQERWIDVDLTTQTLVAYQGPQPVYATLVSTGRGPAGTPNATPPGLHRVWVKLLASDMANITTEDGDQHYSLEDVPYVQFFDSAVALHGTYWHGDFGHPDEPRLRQPLDPRRPLALRLHRPPPPRRLDRRLPRPHRPGHPGPGPLSARQTRAIRARRRPRRSPSVLGASVLRRERGEIGASRGAQFVGKRTNRALWRGPVAPSFADSRPGRSAEAPLAGWSGYRREPPGASCAANGALEALAVAPRPCFGAFLAFNGPFNGVVGAPCGKLGASNRHARRYSPRSMARRPLGGTPTRHELAQPSPILALRSPKPPLPRASQAPHDSSAPPARAKRPRPAGAQRPRLPRERSDRELTPPSDQDEPP